MFSTESHCLMHSGYSSKFSNYENGGVIFYSFKKANVLTKFFHVSNRA